MAKAKRCKSTLENTDKIATLTKSAVVGRDKGLDFNQWSKIIRKHFAKLTKEDLEAAWEISENEYKTLQDFSSNEILAAIRVDEKNAPIIGKKKVRALNQQTGGRRLVSVDVKGLWHNTQEWAALEGLKAKMKFQRFFIKTLEPLTHIMPKLDRTFGTTMFSEYLDLYRRALHSAKTQADAVMNGYKERKKGTNMRRVGMSMVLDDPNQNVREFMREFFTDMGMKVDIELNPAELKLKDYVQEKYDELWNVVNRTRKAAGLPMINYRPNYITFVRLNQELQEDGGSLITSTAQKITAKLKTLDPFADPKFAQEYQDAKARGSKADLAERQKKLMKVVDPKFKFAKRANKKEGVSINLDEIFESYVRQATRYQYVAPVSMKVKEMLQHKNLQNSSDSSITQMKEVMTDWANDIIGVKRPEALSNKPVLRALDRLSSNIAIATMAGSIRTMIIQPTALLHSMSSGLGVNATVSGMGKFLADPGRTWKFAMGNSFHLPLRKPDVVIEDFWDTLQERGIISKVKKGRDKIAALAMEYMIGKTDMVTAVMGWTAAYEKFKGEGKSHTEAVRFADRFIELSQGSVTPGTRAPIQLTKSGKMLTLFQSFAINEFFLVLNQIGSRKWATKPGQEAVTLDGEVNGIGKAELMERMATFMIGMALVNSMYEDLLNMDSPMPAPFRRMLETMSDMDPDTGVGTAMSAAFREGVGQIPIIGGGAQYGSGFVGPVGDFLDDITDWGSGRKGAVQPKRQIAAKLLGIPFSNSVLKAIRLNNHMTYSRDADYKYYMDYFVGAYGDHRRLVAEIVSGKFDAGDFHF